VRAEVTKRRWQQVTEDELALGPVEQAVNDELEKLGYTPLTPAGPLRTAAVRALGLAETFDRTQAAAYLPGIDRQLGIVMADARLAAQPSAVPKDPAEEEEVDDFTRRRQGRRQPPPTGTEDK
jgi:hypothetical protein